MKKKTWLTALGVVMALGAGVWLLMPEEVPEPPPRPSGQLMTAVVYHEFGTTDVLRFEKLPKLLPNDQQVLVKIRAASVNPLDWHYMRGTPYIIRLLGTGVSKPNDPHLGVDLAGVVEAVGAGVTRFKPGDEVFGTADGSFAEYVDAREARLELKPTNLSFEEAAAVPVAALTALQALRDAGHVQAGQKVLINGASGGVGTFAVQIAKSMGAEVTGVCSTRNVDLVHSLGADRVIDYTKEDFRRSGQHYDVIMDNVGTGSLADFKPVLTPKGTLIMIGGGGPHSGVMLGPLARTMWAMIEGPFNSQHFATLFAEVTAKDLAVMKQLIETGKVKPVIDKTYALTEVPAAMKYVEDGHARAKVVVTMAQNH